MAEAVVSAVVADVVGRVISLLAGKLQNRRGVVVEGKLRRLRHLVVKLESVVEAADARRITSRALLEWLSEVIDGAHRGRYFLDAFGLGKTTLVQHVCDEPAVRRRFSLIMMVDFHCISLTVASETVQLLRSLFTVPSTSTASTTASIAGAGEQLSLLERKLRGERFLAVFDNVDPRKKQVIEAIMPALRRSRRGSRIIVTGGDKHDVVDLGTTEPIILRPAQYWFFFEAHAFGGADDAEADPRLAAAGQAIAERLRGSFFGAKVVGALLRSRPDRRLWRRLLAACHAESPLLGNGGYVSAAAGSLLPPHMTVLGVAVSGSPVRGLVGLQDATLTAPVRGRDSERSELPVLLCKSIFPSYCLYYTAYCTIDRESRL